MPKQAKRVEGKDFVGNCKKHGDHAFWLRIDEDGKPVKMWCMKCIISIMCDSDITCIVINEPEAEDQQKGDA